MTKPPKKITDEIIQDYLFGETKGALNEWLLRVDNEKNKDLLDEDERVAQKKSENFEKSMIFSAKQQCHWKIYQPIRFTKLMQFCASLLPSEKFFKKLLGYTAGINVPNFAGGAVMATCAMFAFINISPSVFIGLVQQNPNGLNFKGVETSNYRGGEEKILADRENSRALMELREDSPAEILLSTHEVTGLTSELSGSAETVLFFKCQFTKRHQSILCPKPDFQPNGVAKLEIFLMCYCCHWMIWK